MQDAEGVGFVDLVAVTSRLNVKFVERAFVHTGDEALPDAGGAARREQVRLRIPVVKAADDRNLAGIRRPDAEDRAVDCVARNQMRPHGLV